MSGYGHIRRREKEKRTIVYEKYYSFRNFLDRWGV